MNSGGKGKVALVTGAGTGIGKAVALALLREDYSVVLVGRRAEPLNEVVAASGAGKRALAVPCDVSQPEAVRAAFDKVSQVFGRLDLLFNNAGVGAPPVPMEELTFEQWQNVVNINLTGSFLCAAGYPADEGTVATGRAHHQQWLDLSPRAAPQLSALHRDQTCHHRPDQVDLARLPPLQHCLWAN